ncbi:MAG: aconitase family protein [Methylacidiphilales bacterium]|nr:aconitase family protein [Candidatus Methylacidiphilales bacterium]
MAKTIFDKIWDEHVLPSNNSNIQLLYVDRVILHERTGGIALQGVEDRALQVRRPESVYAIIDHAIDTFANRTDFGLVPHSEIAIQVTRSLANKFKINLYDINDENQGISHVVVAERGIAIPGSVIVCPDSHTGTLGALGCLGIGIGTSQAEQALITRTISVTRPKNIKIEINGTLSKYATAKDIVLAILQKYGTSVGHGAIIEYCGSLIKSIPLEGRMTICNMSVELGAFSGIISPDQITTEYFFSTPIGATLESSQLHTYIHSLSTDSDAIFENNHAMTLQNLLPRISYGISPDQNISIDQPLPAESSVDPEVIGYMGLSGVSYLQQLTIQGAFIGSCTNSRFSDLELVASFLKGKKINKNMKALIVPGSSRVKKMAEAKGFDKIFLEAGFEWRESGCSLCFFAGGESFPKGSRVLSSTNRNFKNRQGAQVKTHLASPLIVALGAVIGRIPSLEDLRLIT